MMLVISVEPDGRWFVSLCAERQALSHEPQVQRSAQELAYELGLQGKDALQQQLVVGLDRGVAVPVASSTAALATIPPASLQRIQRKEQQAKRLQRRMARQRIARCNILPAQVKWLRLGADCGS